MTVETATKKLNTAQGALEKLQGNRAVVAEKLDELKAKRSAAVRRLAKGVDPENERRVIRVHEVQIDDLKNEVEGFDGLLIEAEEEVRLARVALDAAAAKEQTVLAAYIRQCQDAERDAVVADLPDRLKRIADLAVALGKEMGSLLEDAFRFERWPGNQNLILQACDTFHPSMDRLVQAAPCQPLIVDRLGLVVRSLVKGRQKGFALDIGNVVQD